MTIRILSLLLGIFAFSPALQAEGEWAQFRGDRGQGQVNAQNLPVQFGETENLAWKTEVPGVGWSSPSISGNEIWLTTAVKDEAAEQISLRAICVNAQTGTLETDLELFRIPGAEKIHADNSFASPTPVIGESQVICHFGTYGTAGIDRKERKVTWSREDYHVKHQGGPGSSPVPYGQNVILTYDGADEQFVVAVKQSTGEEVWKVSRSAPLREAPDTHRAFATPAIWTVDGKDLLISPGPDQVHAYDPATGAEVWHVRYTGFSNVPVPVFNEKHVFVCTGFYETEILALTPGGSGDVGETHVSWRYGRSVSTVPSPILVGNQVFSINEEGLAVCLDAETGEVLGRRRMNGAYSASPISWAGKLYFCEESGRITVVEATPEMPTVQVNRVEGELKASPAVRQDDLIIRTSTHVYCFRQ
ncbi:MAG: PQQ-binding-like beta-propeller repeat protein [Planctomycetaceae bacterium]|nr:PQQ-binding-like beta-propeller repeat protein [Planctomycetaceae bacterium]